MSDPSNPRAPRRYAVPQIGGIGPIRKNLLERAYGWLGEQAVSAGQKLDFANTLATGAMRGALGLQDAPDVTSALPVGELTGLTSGGSALVDSSNGLPLARMDNGLMSLHVDNRVPDALGVLVPGSIAAGRVAREVAEGAAYGVGRAGTEFLEAGATGTRMWTGPKSATWNAGKAQAFEDFEQAGGSPESLWRAFGTARLKDGSLIQEIDDSKAVLKTDFAFGKQSLSDVIDHPDFEAAYPQLAKEVKVNLSIDPSIKGRGHGAYDSDKKLLTVVAKDMNEARRLMLHEMNHSVSRFEGRATGGSPRKAGAMVDAALADPSTSPELREKLKQIAYDDYEAYQRLQDEVAARGVEGRRDMTPEQRAETAPEWDRDPEDWIVSRDDAPGISMALKPEDGRMPGLPESVALPDGSRAAVEPISDLRRIALDFMREKGLDPNLTTDEFRRVDPARGKAIADTFEAMKNDPSNPIVQASYRALVEDVKGQYEALQGMGYKFSFIEPGMADPYAASPRLAIEDLKQNKHLWVYPTDAGFGNADAVAQSATNPLLAPTGVQIGGRELVANDLFRIVHDVWGHAKEGVGFRADGEENAWLQHLPTFRPQSRMALTTETRGQNSWLNFGPHGEANRTANSADTVFAPQKVGDLPAWVMDPNGMPPQGPVQTKAALNIGLKIGDTGELDPDEALAALRGLGIDVTESGIMRSGTENTLVVGINRPLAPAEAEMLSRAVRQEAIAQKVGKKGELFGPGKDKWGPFNDEYFLQLNKLRDAAKRGQADPPIFDYSLLEKDPGRRIELPMYDPPRGTPEREARLLRSPNAFKRLVEFARKGMTNDGLGWYNTEELRSEFIKEWGAEKGVEQYEKFIDLVGATSAGAKTDANLKIASRYYVENVQGLPTTKPAKGSGYGHKVQGEHYRSAKNLLEGVPLDPIEHPKRSRFAANLKGDWTHSTIDKHNVRALAIASRDKEWVATRLAEGEDAAAPAFWNKKRHGEWNPAKFNPREFVESTRMPFDKIPVGWFEDAPKGTAYKALSQLNERLAAELGVTPAQAQAALWLGAGDMTGLGSKPIALMKVLDQRLSITARKRKITKREALRQMISGENPLLGVAGAASLLPLLADDGDGA